MERSDDTLMQAVAAGDDTAFRILVERWEKRIHAFAWRALGDEAQDVVQETFLRVFSHADRYVPGGRFQAWLFRITGNLVRNEIRRRKVRRFLSLDFGDESSVVLELPDPGLNPDQSYQEAQRARAVHAAILNLPDRQRVALVLKKYENLKQSEIGEILGISEKAVESLLSRAMATLRKQLRGKGD
jgi:RNA polymerase sigma-70 factor (ECF subfamily)